MSKTLLFVGWIISSILLLLYSFTQVDLNLTLSQISLWQVIQKSLQSIGYFNRTLSTTLFLFLLLLLFFLYLATLKALEKGTIDRRELWKIILITSCILFFSYNAFSYDFFNYIFDARIVSHYHLNPYEHKPQEFASDPMLHFMRSVHRSYPYGPVWLGLSIPLSFLGSGIFLLTFYLFKLLVLGSFLVAAYFVEKIARFINEKYAAYSLALFALNPLILIEALVSAHNDIVMIFFALFAVYLLLRKRYIFSIVLLLLSAGVKFATVFLVPIFLMLMFTQTIKGSIAFSKVLSWAFILMTLSAVAMSLASGPKTPEPQPWYLINVIPFAALLSQNKLVYLLTMFVSFGMLLFYVPFLHSGQWPKNIIEIKLWIVGGALLFGGLAYLISSVRKNSSVKHIS